MSLGIAMNSMILPCSTVLPEWISLPPTIALSVPFTGVPATLKVTACLGVGAGAGDSGDLGFAFCGQPVNNKPATNNNAVKNTARFKNFFLIFKLVFSMTNFLLLKKLIYIKGNF